MERDQDGYEEFVLWKEHCENQRSGPPVVVRRQTDVPHSPVPGSALVEKLIDKAPAWIMMLMAAILGYVTLNQRVSTLEYQAQTSISDREKLHNDVNIMRDGLSGIKTDLADIKARVTDLVERGPRR